MGSPISAVVANLNMEFFEELSLEMADVSSPEEKQEKGPLVVIPSERPNGDWKRG